MKRILTIFLASLFLMHTFTGAALAQTEVPADFGAKGALQDTSITLEEALVYAIQDEYLAALSEADKERLFPYGTTDGFAVEVWNFCHSIANGRRPEMDGHDGLRAKALCEACYESATAGRPVKYADVLEGRIDAYQQPIDSFWGI